MVVVSCVCVRNVATFADLFQSDSLCVAGRTACTVGLCQSVLILTDLDAFEESFYLRG